MWQSGGEGVLGRMGTCIYMAESLHCLPETMTTLLIGYTPVQNYKEKKERKISVPSYPENPVFHSTLVMQ